MIGQHGYCRRGRGGLMVSLLLLLWSGPAAAGQEGTGSIVGQVSDESGAVLPGVTVTLTSPALQTQQLTVVTDGQGQYRLTQLPIGTYSVAYELSGFQPVRREGVRLTLGFVAKLDQVMGVGTLAETIVVSGQSPIVDVVSSGARTELTRENVDLIPSSRDGISSFLGQVPGVRQKFDVGGAAFSDTTVLRAHGLSGQAWMLLEGVFAYRLTGSQGNDAHYDFNSLEGTRVQVVGNSAEMPRAGMLIDMVTKSGGNQFSGEVLYGGTNQSLQGDNVDDELRAAGLGAANKIDSRQDVSGALGGKIVANKLWFYGSARHRKVKEELFGVFLPDGSPALRDQKQRFYVGKLSYQMRSQDKLIGFVHGAQNRDLNRGGNQFVPFDATDSNTERYETVKAEWQGTRGNALAMSLQVGMWPQKTTRFAHAPGRPRTVDDVTTVVSGDHLNEGRYSAQFNYHNRGVATLYQSELFRGSHEFKVGYDHLRSKWQDVRGARRSGDYELHLQNGVPFEINVFNTPADQLNRGNYVGVYLQDRWTVGRRLTLNLGVRYAHDQAYIPDQCREPGSFGVAACFDGVDLRAWNTVVPRLHSAYDVFGNGTAVLKGGWGRFAAMREIAQPELTAINPNKHESTRYRWRDLNGNRDYDPGEVNLSLTGPDFISFSAGTNGIRNPDDKPRTMDEFSVGYDQQLMPNFAIRLGWIYNRQDVTQRIENLLVPYEVYNIPITNRDPGPDGAVGTADDAGLVTYFDFPAQFRGLSQQKVILRPDEQTGKTIEVAAIKRLHQDWQFMASYSATKKHVPFAEGTAFLNPNGAAGLPFNPNTEINTADDTWEWLAKFSGSYILPYGIIPSFNFQHRSGDPLARQVRFTGGRQIPNIVLNVEPLGSLRLPNINLLDVSVEKQFSLPREGMELGVKMDVFNVTNINDATVINVRSGPTFRAPTAVVLPRIFAFTGTLKF